MFYKLDFCSKIFLAKHCAGKRSAVAASRLFSSKDVANLFFSSCFCFSPGFGTIHSQKSKSMTFRCPTGQGILFLTWTQIRVRSVRKGCVLCNVSIWIKTGNILKAVCKILCLSGCCAAGRKQTCRTIIPPKSPAAECAESCLQAVKEELFV